MNKKFFAALASATMAFTASGSIAVFADDFVEENNVVKPGDLEQIEKEVVFNKENFGDLVNDKVSFKDSLGSPVTLTKNEKYNISKFEDVSEIEFAAGFKGEIKGLEYFTKLTKFNDAAITATGKIKNETLDFSANTALTEIKVTLAPELTEIKLPKPEIKEDKKEEYHLATLELKGTKLTKLDLSAQENLVKDGSNGSITVTGNKNLKEVTLKSATSAKVANLATLDLSGNALETVNLDNYTIGTKLDLSGNHIGALNLSKTTASNAKLDGQTFYVYEKAANVNLKEAFADLDVDYVEATDTKFDSETGVLTLKTTGNTTYKYDTKVGKGTNKLEVELVPANPMNRVYNPNSGEHFYTADVKEKEALISLGWQDEGYGWVAPTTPTTVTKTSDQPVYRLYNPNAGDHHYTMSKEERNTLVAYGWKDENVGWYSAEDTKHNGKTVPVYRQYNPYANGAGSHNYTADRAENNYLVSLGWVYEGTAWNALR